MWSSLRLAICQLMMFITITFSTISVKGASFHHHFKRDQVLPVPPITVISGPAPSPNPFPYAPTLSASSSATTITTEQQVVPSNEPFHNHPQCELVCAYDPTCQKMTFEPPTGISYCACACQVCQGQYYGPTTNFQNAQPLSAFQVQNCPNFVYGNA